MLAKKRRKLDHGSRQSEIIIYIIFSILIIVLLVSFIRLELVFRNIPIIVLGFLFVGIIFFFLTMKREGNEQDGTRATRKGSAKKVRKDKDDRYHHSTSDQSVQADGSIVSTTTRPDQSANEKRSGKGGSGTKSESSHKIRSTKNRSSPQHKKMQDTGEKDEILLPPDEQQEISTPIPEELWNFPKELLDRYEPLGVLGDDAYAQVYLVRNKKEDEIRSLKISKSTEPASEMVMKESSIWRKMKHPNITALYLSEFDPFKFLENEYVPGVLYKGERYLSLSALPKPIKEKYAVSLVLDVANALLYTHALGLRHYHLQPGNIFITPKLEAKVSGFARGKNEFGFATRYASIDVRNEPDERIAHIAPEQREGSNETLSTRTDLYQLGTIFYELLTGYKPYTKRLYQFIYPDADENQIDNEYDHFFIPPSHVVSRLAPYDNMVQHLIAQEKKERYPSVKEFVADLKAMHQEIVQ